MMSNNPTKEGEVETFEVSEVLSEGEKIKPGWYWAVKGPTHLSDTVSYGPFDTQEAALEDSRQTLEE